MKRVLYFGVMDMAKDVNVAEGACADFENALNNYFDWKAGKRTGPKVGFPKLGSAMLTEPLRFAGKIIGAVVSNMADWWFVSITIQMECP
jgi:putative transposase